MPRNYKAKPGVVKRQQYNQDNLKAAVQSVQSGKLTQLKASVLFKVPRVTILRHGKDPTLPYGAGGKTQLTHDEESQLVAAIVSAGDFGFPMKKSDIIDIAEAYVKARGRKTSFKNCRPSTDWFIAFQEHWKKELSARKPEILTISRAISCNVYVVSKFFDILESKLQELDLADSPARIINLDETGFVTDPKSKKVFVKKGKKNPCIVIPGSGKEMYTVLSTVAANGKVFPPYILFKAKNIYDGWCTGGPPGTGYGATTSGWMEAASFASWFRKCFLNQVSKLKKPLLVIFDGHSSHITVDLIKTAKENEVNLLCLPPHCSHLLQPLDVGVFGPAKTKWSQILAAHYKDSRMKSASIGKAIFPSLLKKLYEQSFKPEHIISGFMKSGVYPLNRDSVPKEKLLPAEVFFKPVSDELAPDTTTLSAVPCLDNQIQPIASTSSLDDAVTLDTSPVSTTIDQTPRSVMRAAVLHQLRSNQVDEPKARKKGRAVKRAFGECLTESEVLQRLEAEESEKQKKKDEILQKRENAKKKKENKKLTVQRKKAVPMDVVSPSDSESGSLSQHATNSAIDDENMITADFHVGDYVAAVYDKVWYVGCVSKPATALNVEINFMKPNGTNRFIWPSKADVLLVPRCDILCKVSPPAPVSSRHLGLLDNDYSKILSNMQDWMEVMF